MFCEVDDFVRRSNSQRRTICWPAFSVFVGGMYLAAYGIAACQHSRWETRAEAARIVNVYHPWAIVLGLAMVIVGLWYARPGAAKGRR
jgi:hypothetical protein